MILSEERQGHLAKLVCDGIWNDDLVDFEDEDRVMRIAKTAILAFVKDEDDIDKEVRKKLTSLKRNVIENSSEWEILYKKYYEEEMRRLGNG